MRPHQRNGGLLAGRVVGRDGLPGSDDVGGISAAVAVLPVARQRERRSPPKPGKLLSWLLGPIRIWLVDQGDGVRLQGSAQRLVSLVAGGQGERRTKIGEPLVVVRRQGDGVRDPDGRAVGFQERTASLADRADRRACHGKRLRDTIGGAAWRKVGKQDLPDGLAAEAPFRLQAEQLHQAPGGRSWPRAGASSVGQHDREAAQKLNAHGG
jgi:hypothetical protein